ncbi:ABC-three component system protein [Azohydromonas lata]|uniref:ABC-three component system protein n=1 Tax=Azohydromonas lata TaxID=45677 RepID=UPI0009FDCC8E|nr:ABC-three component system protein [Azohydromonas lata]
MQRSIYWNICEEKLSLLCTRVEMRGVLNILDFHLHCEDFYAQFLNLLLGYSLVNMNASIQNADGIDLIDTSNKIVLQVSSTATKAKVESSLCKNLSAYKGHKFNFVSISKDASNLRDKVYQNPHSLVFHPATDVHDVKSILQLILHFDIARQQEIHDFLRKELPSQSDATPSETNIATIIGILAKEDLYITSSDPKPIPFDIDKKLVFNNLDTAAEIVEDYKVHHHRIARVYAEFDTIGKNKSTSVLNSLRKSYLKLSQKYSGDQLFFQVVDQAVQTVKNSANYIAMPLEELEMCVNILVVDAFIRCRIFKNPEENAHAST